jgi:hypothetical protein
MCLLNEIISSLSSLARASVGRGEKIINPVAGSVALASQPRYAQIGLQPLIMGKSSVLSLKFVA